MVSSGFAEAGPAGLVLQHELALRARVLGVRLIGPNCLGVINTASEVSLNASLAPMVPGRGRVGFFAQSGALGVALLGGGILVLGRRRSTTA